MNKQFFLGIFLAAIFLVPLANEALAIGMITEPIVLENMLRGGETTQLIKVFNPESSEAVYELGASGQIQGWVQFFEKGKPDSFVTNVAVPPKSYYDVFAKIKVPEGTPNGTYAGEINVKQNLSGQVKSTESAVAVAQMVSQEVKITVTDKEVVKLSTTVIPESYDVKINEPLKIRLIYENLGNISLKPSFQLKIVSASDGKTILNAIYPYPDNEPAVGPGERKIMPVLDWPTSGQQSGKYLVEATSLVGSEAVGRNNFRFSLGYSSTQDGKVLGAFISLIGGGNTKAGWAVLAGVIILAAVLSAYLIYKKRKNTSSLRPVFLPKTKWLLKNVQGRIVKS